MESQRASQADSLTLTSAELVRIAVEVRRVEADEVKELGDPIAPRPAVTQAVDDERLLDDLSRAHARVEGRIRILKDDLHVAPRLTQAPAGKGQHVLAPDSNFARFATFGTLGAFLARPAFLLDTVSAGAPAGVCASTKQSGNGADSTPAGSKIDTKV